MKIRFLLLLLIALCSSQFLRADEGMWIPLYLKYREADMQKMGFKLTADDIYNVNSHSMKDAIMLFGGGCTAELISPNGLIVTNHHCGYSYVQKYSTIENNYLHNGFWATSKNEEIPMQGLTVTFLVRMEDVTEKVLATTENYRLSWEKDSIIKLNIDNLIKTTAKGTHYEVVIKPFFYGNQYFMFVNETYKDIRLVGVPPESIGKFGGDTDNWMWPRHTGDFSLYRIYTASNGLPAEYNEKNIPLKSKQFFPISIKGVEENDFTMVLGYPGTTTQFLTADGVDVIVNQQNPVAIHQRGSRLDIMKKYMDQSTEIRLMYSAKANSISNGWKKWIGENKGITECHVIDHKKEQEAIFRKWAMSLPYKNPYSSILDSLQNNYSTYRNFVKTAVYYNETFQGIELLNFLGSNLLPLIDTASKATNSHSENLQKARQKLIKNIEKFYASYYKPIDKEIFVELICYYFTTIDATLIPKALQPYSRLSRQEWQTIADTIYEQSPFKNAEAFISMAENASKEQLINMRKHLALQLIDFARQQILSQQDDFSKIRRQQATYYQTYVRGLMLQDTQKVFYPDANLTMRATYGKVQGFSPEDGIAYIYYTTIDGIIKKENPDIFDYKVDAKLKSLYKAKDYGRYANAKGELPVAFIASNHTTGGNSGSPVINASGALAGINFDRVWEGTMSDLNYDVNRCRNISLDVRYMLFIIDKFANAQNIINELTIIQ